MSAFGPSMTAARSYSVQPRLPENTANTINPEHLRASALRRGDKPSSNGQLVHKAAALYKVSISAFVGAKELDAVNRALLSTCDHGCTGTSFESEEQKAGASVPRPFLSALPGSAAVKMQRDSDRANATTDDRHLCARVVAFYRLLCRRRG